MTGYVQHEHGQLFKREQGNILVVFTIALFALIAMAALAIDGGHMLLHKTRLQNIADAAALHAAKTLDEGGSHQEARAAAIEIIQLNLAHSDNHEINDALDLSSFDTLATQVTANISVDFSKEPDPFDSLPYDEDARYVKVEIRNLNLNNFLADILNFSKRVSATALAGITPPIEDCPLDLVPLVICGDPNSNEEQGSEDGEGGYNEGMWGLDFESLYALKIGSATDPDVGPGNFQFLDLPGDLLKYQMAGGVGNAQCTYNAESLEDYPVTKPGNTVSVAKGVNTRFDSHTGEFSGTAADYPRDWNTCQGKTKVEVYSTKEAEAATAASAIADNPPIVYQAGDINPDTTTNVYSYDQYEEDVTDEKCSSEFKGNVDKTSIPEQKISGYQRRVFNIVIADCAAQEGEDEGTTEIEETSQGKTTVKQLDLGCFFLTQEMIQKGNEAYIVGELIEDCNGDGTFTGTANDDPGPHRIVLYHVPGSKDS